MMTTILKKQLRTGAPIFLCLAVLLTSCSSSRDVAKATGPEMSRYREAMVEFEKENYDDAAIELEALLFSTRATDLEDDVLYSLGRAYYESEQYMLASEIYRRLLQQTPDSPYVRDAQFQLARSYEQLSPTHELDQEYSVKAISEFSSYLDLYPVDDSSAATPADIEAVRELMNMNPENDEYRKRFKELKNELSRVAPAKYSQLAIVVLRDRIAQNRFSVAETYVQLDKFRAAAIYYDLVIRQYPDTKWIEPAWIGKIDVAMKQNKWFEAREAIQQYEQLFPGNAGKIEDRSREVNRKFEQS